MIELNQHVLPTFLRPAGLPGSRNKPPPSARFPPVADDDDGDDA